MFCSNFCLSTNSKQKESYVYENKTVFLALVQITKNPPISQPLY